MLIKMKGDAFNTLQVEAIVKDRKHPKSLENFDVSTHDLTNDATLLSSVNVLYSPLQEAAQATIKIIAHYIRANPEEFVRIESD